MEIIRQVTTCSKMFSSGYHRPTPGRIIILPANYAIAGLQSGSFEARRSQNGKHLKSGVPLYGFMGNVRQCAGLALSQGLKCVVFVAGAGKSVLW